jgi:aspartate racemase
MHIGLIGGIGPAATEFYYRGLIDRHTREGTTLDLTIVHADVREMTRNLANRDPAKQAKIFAHLIQRLSAAGAQTAAITSMGGHFAMRELEPMSALPLINALPAVNLALRRMNLSRVGLIGTRTVMESRLYGSICDAEVVLPVGEALEATHRNYVEMAIAARVTPQQREVFFSIGRQLCQDQGAEAIMLGGTDLFLAFEDQEPGFPVIDCAAIHIEAIYRASVATSVDGVSNE